MGGSEPNVLRVQALMVAETAMHPASTEHIKFTTMYYHIVGRAHRKSTNKVSHCRALLEGSDPVNS